VLVLARVPALVGVPGRFLQVELQPVQLSAATILRYLQKYSPIVESMGQIG
jgi:hypothetical protein